MVSAHDRRVARRHVLGIGNPAPFPGTEDFPSGSSRPGDNLYTNSVLAMDPKSGALDWYFQEAPHDLFARDFQNPPIPIRVRIGDVEKRLVIGSGKTGTVIALNADNGELLWRTAVGRHQNDDLTTIPSDGVVVFPGVLGGIPTPLAYADGTIYVPVVNWGRTYYPTTAGDFEVESTGELVAINAADGVIRWSKSLSSTATSSVTVVNDLVFTATFDGNVYAFDRNDGSEVFRYAAPPSINAPLTIVNNLVLIPVGATETPALMALKLP